jgi:integrase
MKPVWWVFLGIGADGWSSVFQSVDRLLEHLKRKSRSLASRYAYCYHLWITCLWVTLKLKDPDFDLEKNVKNLKEKWLEVAENRELIDPDRLILMAKENPEVVAGLIQELADKYFDLGSIRYANHIIALAKTFFKVNKIELDLKGRTKHTRSGRRRQEYIPSLSEALKIVDVAGSLRDRLIILVLTYTGLRNSTLRALVYDEAYPDPLLQEYTIKKQLGREEKHLAIVVDEVMKKHVPNACKNNIPYYTFIPPKVTECLQLYLREMERKYGALRALRDDRPIFHTENRRISLNERLRTCISARELQYIVKSAAKRAGIRNWKYVYPHCLRKTYDSFLRNQPDTVRLDIQDRQFVSGHTMPGSQDTYYDKTKIEEMRAKYSKMVFEPVVIETEERVVSDDELPTCFQQGWRFVAALQSGKVVVSRQVSVNPEDTEATSNTQAVNSIFQKEKTQACSKVHTTESTSLVSDAKEVCNSLESNTNPSITDKGKHNSYLEATNLPKVAEAYPPKDISSSTENSDTREKKDTQNSAKKYTQKTLFD